MRMECSVREEASELRVEVRLGDGSDLCVKSRGAENCELCRWRRLFYSEVSSDRKQIDQLLIHITYFQQCYVRLNKTMVCKEEVFHWFQELSGAKRIELMCGLMKKCIPLEIRFFGAIIQDLARKDYIALKEAEYKANSVNELETICSCNLFADKLDNCDEIQNVIEKDVNSAKDEKVKAKEMQGNTVNPTNELASLPSRSKLVVSLCLLASTNRSCSNLAFKALKNQLTAENIATLLGQKQLLPEECKNLFDEVLLLLTMALHHPAFSYEQKTAMNAQKSQVEFLADSLSGHLSHNPLHFNPAHMHHHQYGGQYHYHPPNRIAMNMSQSSTGSNLTNSSTLNASNSHLNSPNSTPSPKSSSSSRTSYSTAMVPPLPAEISQNCSVESLDTSRSNTTNLHNSTVISNATSPSKFTNSSPANCENILKKFKINCSLEVLREMSDEEIRNKFDLSTTELKKLKKALSSFQNGLVNASKIEMCKDVKTEELNHKELNETFPQKHFSNIQPNSQPTGKMSETQFNGSKSNLNSRSMSNNINNFHLQTKGSQGIIHNDEKFDRTIMGTISKDLPSKNFNDSVNQAVGSITSCPNCLCPCDCSTTGSSITTPSTTPPPSQSHVLPHAFQTGMPPYWNFFPMSSSASPVNGYATPEQFYPYYYAAILAAASTMPIPPYWPHLAGAQPHLPPNLTLMMQNLKMNSSCYNCGQTGHRGDECNAPTLDESNTYSK